MVGHHASASGNLTLTVCCSELEEILPPAHRRSNHSYMGRRIADKLFKLPVDIKKSVLLMKLRVPVELVDAANPDCPEHFRAGDTVSLGGQYLASSGQTVYSVARELDLKPYDIVKLNEDLNPIYPLQAGSIYTIPLPRDYSSLSPEEAMLVEYLLGQCRGNCLQEGGVLASNQTSEAIARASLLAHSKCTQAWLSRSR